MAGVIPVDFTGKTIKDFVYVNHESLLSEAELMEWINLGIEHTNSKI